MILTHGANSISRGGDNTVTIDGYTYNFIKIGSLYWITENLRVNAPNATTYREQSDINEYGLYYQPNGDFPVIEGYLTDGWRIATRDDFLSLYALYGNSDREFIKNCFSDRYSNGENLSGLNLLSCGYRGANSYWYNDNINSIIWTSTKKTTASNYDLYTGMRNSTEISISGTFMDDSTTSNSTYRCVVRICKDA